MIPHITIGADPELFVRDLNLNFVSSIDKFGGSKENPYPIGQGCFVQEDNVAVEFNIPAQSSVERFVQSIEYALDSIRKRAEELKLDLAIVPAAYFDEKELVDPKAKEFGCEPDRNAWTLKQNPRPTAVNAALRSAGGHVHVGCNLFCNEHAIAGYDVIRAMDLFLGVPSLATDQDTVRRQLYGKAGAYREKSYGVEYRTLSNFWITSPGYMKWVFNQTHRALEFLEIGNRLSLKEGTVIQRCINDSDMNLMDALIKKYGLETANV